MGGLFEVFYLDNQNTSTCYMSRARGVSSVNVYISNLIKWPMMLKSYPDVELKEI